MSSNSVSNDGNPKTTTTPIDKNDNMDNIQNSASGDSKFTPYVKHQLSELQEFVYKCEALCRARSTGLVSRIDLGSTVS